MSDTLVNSSPSGTGGARRLPTLGPWQRLTCTFDFRRDQIGFLVGLARDHGDIVRFRVGGMPMVAITHPDHIRHVLVDNHENYDKNSFIYRAVAPVLRGGLIGNYGGESWRRQRRLATPSFHRPRVVDFSSNMTDEISAMVGRWDRDFTGGETVNVTSELGYVAMRVVTRTLFGADIGDSSERIEAEFLEANVIIGRFLRLPFPPLSGDPQVDVRIDVAHGHQHMSPPA
ncbi:cytochrome P450 [Kibdelosporangium lantanae]|uniref:Cytochrome P450 n=1 Tax=Kibdelosporangium lantanae TaxID=1497396 RepID=A0ABW3M8Q7_9PSEU